MLSFPYKASDLIFSLCLPLPHLPGLLFSWSLLTRPNSLPLSTFMCVCHSRGTPQPCTAPQILKAQGANIQQSSFLTLGPSPA